MQQAANEVVQHWFCWHVEAGTRDRLRDLQAWYAGGKTTAKPAAVGAAWPKELRKSCYDLLAARFGDVTGRARDCLLNWLSSTTTEQKSPQRRWKRWQCVLLDLERPWWFGEPLPVRFDSGNARLARDGDKLILRARLERDRESGASATCELRILRPKNNDSHRAAAYRGEYQFAAEIADGKRTLRGSQLVRGGSKWFCMLTVEASIEPLAVDRGRTAVLRPGKKDPWRMRATTAAGKHLTGGFGRIKWREERLSLLETVTEVRERIVESRERWKGIAAESPRPRGMGADHLRGKWNRACTNINRETAKRIATVIRAEKIGRLIVLLGDGRSLLETAGRSDDACDPTAFPMAQLGRFLTESLAPQGVEVIVRASLRSAKRSQEKRRQRFAKERV